MCDGRESKEGESRRMTVRNQLVMEAKHGARSTRGRRFDLSHASADARTPHTYAHTPRNHARKFQQHNAVGPYSRAGGKFRSGLSCILPQLHATCEAQHLCFDASSNELCTMNNKHNNKFMAWRSSFRSRASSSTSHDPHRTSASVAKQVGFFQDHRAHLALDTMQLEARVQFLLASNSGV